MTVHFSSKIKWTVVFILIGIGLSPRLWSYPSVTINNARFVAMPGSPIHHGVEVETDGIIDPNLTTYEVQVKPDNGAPFPPWAVYSAKLLPHDGRLVNLLYRNGILSLRAEALYCVRMRAIYGETVTPWAEHCGLAVLVVEGSDSDDDGDGLSERQEYALGIDPRDPDTDRDGHSDGAEVADGRDPDRSQFPRLIIRTASLDFGEGNPFGGRRNQHRIIEVENVGDEPAQIDRIEIADLLPAEPSAVFQLGSHPTTISQIPPQNRIFIPVSFIPRRRGEANAEVRISSNDPDPLPPIPLRGVGVQIPDCLVAPDSIDFGTVGVTDQEVAVRDVTLANRLIPGDTQPPNNDNTPWGFVMSTTQPGMAPGIRGLVLSKDEEINLPVLFQHAEPGDYDGFLEIRSFQCGTQRVHLTGRAR